LQLACTEALFPVFRSLDQALTEGAENTEPIIEPQAHQLEITIQAHPEMVGRVRKAFDRVARRDGLTRMEIEDIKLAVSEACTNAILHGSPLRDRNIVGIRYIRESDRVVIEIKDEGPGMTLENSDIIWPDELVEGKRGLYLIRTLMDDVAYAHGQEGGVLRMEKLCINKR
jgi:serine/threonine-protein kinase RsbW